MIRQSILFILLYKLFDYIPPNLWSQCCFFYYVVMMNLQKKDFFSKNVFFRQIDVWILVCLQITQRCRGRT